MPYRPGLLLYVPGDWEPVPDALAEARIDRGLRVYVTERNADLLPATRPALGSGGSARWTTPS